jgi:hypothetical protein
LLLTTNFKEEKKYTERLFHRHKQKGEFFFSISQKGMVKAFWNKVNSFVV